MLCEGQHSVCGPCSQHLTPAARRGVFLCRATQRCTSRQGPAFIGAGAGESYGEHMRVALSFAGPLAKAAIAALVHAFLPFLFTTTASSTVKRLHDRMARRCANCSKTLI